MVRATGLIYPGASNPLIHSQNSCCRTLASADTAAFCSLISGLLIRYLNCNKLHAIEVSDRDRTAGKILARLPGRGSLEG